MLAKRMWISGFISGGAVGLCVGILLTVFGVCVSMSGENPILVSVQGQAGQVRAVEINGTVYRLISAIRYAELSRYEWAVRHGH